MKPLVSISCLTYNHADFLKCCFEGFLMQQTNFKFEVVIHDDASTDGTRAIIEDYTARFPDVFVPFYQTVNQYSQGVRGLSARFNFPRCRGKYIAMCEGDDYWTDALKLQKQVDFLEANTAYGLVCTNYTSDEINTAKDKNTEIFLKDILKDSAVGTVTAMFKNSIIQPYLQIKANFKLTMGDFPLWVYICSRQRVYKLSDVTAHYRILENSATGRNDVVRRIKFSLDVLTVVKANLDKIEDKKDRYEILQERYGQLFKHLIDAKDKRFVKYQFEYFRLGKTFKSLDFKILIKGIYKVYQD